MFVNHISHISYTNIYFHVKLDLDNYCKDICSNYKPALVKFINKLSKSHFFLDLSLQTHVCVKTDFTPVM